MHDDHLKRLLKESLNRNEEAWTLHTQERLLHTITLTTGLTPSAQTQRPISAKKGSGFLTARQRILLNSILLVLGLVVLWSGIITWLHVLKRTQ